MSDRYRVVLADDHAPTRTIVLEALEEQGFEVVGARRRCAGRRCRSSQAVSRETAAWMRSSVAVSASRTWRAPAGP